jgi:hypothetical protein
MDHSQRNEVEYLLEGDYIGGGWFGIFHYTPTEWQGLKCNSSQLFYFLKKFLWDGCEKDIYKAIMRITLAHPNNQLPLAS